MNAEKLRDLMGGSHTEADARRFRNILVEAGYSGVDSSYVANTARWHDLLDKLEDSE